MRIMGIMICIFRRGRRRRVGGVVVIIRRSICLVCAEQGYGKNKEETSGIVGWGIEGQDKEEGSEKRDG